MNTRTFFFCIRGQDQFQTARFFSNDELTFGPFTQLSDLSDSGPRCLLVYFHLFIYVFIYLFILVYFHLFMYPLIYFFLVFLVWVNV